MTTDLRIPLLGAGLAVAVTTAMDAIGLTIFSALAILPLTGVFWFLQKFSRREIGLTRGPVGAYRLALLYPVIVPGLLVVIAFLAGAINVSSADWGVATRNIALMGSVGTLVVLLTEEGFFRGWLWAACARAGLGDRGILVATSVLFTVWHVSAVTMTDEFRLPAAEIPIYLANVFLIGLVWGMIRLRGGSIVAASLSHAVWNAVVYALFGFGERVGALGIKATHLFGPEVGLLGLAANGVFAVWLWRRIMPAA